MRMLHNLLLLAFSVSLFACTDRECVRYCKEKCAKEEVCSYVTPVEWDQYDHCVDDCLETVESHQELDGVPTFSCSEALTYSVESGCGDESTRPPDM